MQEGNWWAAILAAIGSGLVTFWISRLSKSYDARGAAEAALIGTGPAIIIEQNKRIAALNADTAKLWDQIQQGYARERKCHEEIQQLQTQVTDQRHQIRSLETKVYALERQLGVLKDSNDGGLE